MNYRIIAFIAGMSGMIFASGCAFLPNESVPQNKPSGILDTVSIPQAEEDQSGIEFLGRVWYVNEIFSKKIRFEAPEGFWVYYSDRFQEYWIVKGEKPEIGSEDPVELAFENRIAIIYPITRSEESFSEWESFESTMAQFDCMEGTVEDDLIVCPTKKSVKEEKTKNGFIYRNIVLQAERQKTKENVGLRTYISVIFDEEKMNGVLIRVGDVEYLDTIRSLVQTFESTEKE